MTSATSDLQRSPVSELRLTLSVVAVAVNGWAIITLLRYVPSLVIRLTASESVGVASYVLSIALLETILLSIPVALIGFALLSLKPHIHLAIYFAGGMVSLIFWFMPCEHRWPPIGTCTPQTPLLGLVLLLSWILLIRIALRRFPDWVGRTYSVLDRLVALAVLYLVIDLVAVLILAGRLFNLAGPS